MYCKCIVCKAGNGAFIAHENVSEMGSFHRTVTMCNVISDVLH